MPKILCAGRTGAYPGPQGIKADRFKKDFKLSSHYNLHDFCANCNRQTKKVCLLFGENIEHFFNNLLEICPLVCYNGLCKHDLCDANTSPIWEVTMSKKFLYLFKEGHDAFGGDQTTKVGGQAVLGRQRYRPTPWLTERHGYDPT